MALYTNTHHERRYWPDLQLAGTGLTVELDPGETADIGDVPDGFDDPYLKPASQPRPPAAPEIAQEAEETSDDH